MGRWELSECGKGDPELSEWGRWELSEWGGGS